MRILLLSNSKKTAAALKASSHLVDWVDAEDAFFEKLCLHEYNLIFLSIVSYSQNIGRLVDEVREEKISTPIVLLANTANQSPQLVSVEKYYADSRLSSKNQIFTLGNLSFDVVRRCFSINDHALNLTLREFVLLEQLCLHRKTFISREKLMRLVLRDAATVQSNLPEVYVYRLRSKLRQHCATVEITHHRYLGYQIKQLRL